MEKEIKLFLSVYLPPALGSKIVSISYFGVIILLLYSQYERSSRWYTHIKRNMQFLLSV